MKRKLQLLGAVLTLALCAGAADAAPKNGFSVNGGLISSSVTTTIVGTGTALDGVSYSYNGSGLSVGFDYQFALNDNLTLNPFVMLSGENISGLGNNITGNHSILGLQLRYWIGDVFIGGHIGGYSETVTNNNYNLSTNASGPGGGLVAGWENPNGGIYMMGQLDSAKLNYGYTDTRLTDVRLSVGDRWK
ncbi:MAG TPA: hypothetical protein VKC56_08905 [Gallionellaceae bacterium]|nr:hypothetical protein [Gallionellaceae bacterium]